MFNSLVFWYYCDDHSSLSSTTAVQIWIISYTSHHFTPHGRYELNKLTSLPMCGFIAQLVEQRGGHRFESRWSPDFFQASSFQLRIGKFTAMIILHFYNHSVVDVVNIMLFFSKVLVSIFFIFQIKSWASGEIAARTWCTRHRNQVCVETSNKIYS